MKFRISCAVASVAMLVAQPCLAAPDFSDPRNADRQTGAFAGMAVKMNLGTGETSRPTARLQLGMTQHHTAQGSGMPLRTSNHGTPLELGLLDGKPMLFVGGQSTRSLKQRAQMSGGDNTWLYVAGGLAVAAAAFLIFADDGTNSEPCIPGNC